MTILDRSWEKEVRQGRLVVLPNDDSYIQEVGVLVSDIVDQLADGLTAIETYTTLSIFNRSRYSGLPAFLFIYELSGKFS